MQKLINKAKNRLPRAKYLATDATGLTCAFEEEPPYRPFNVWEPKEGSNWREVGYTRTPADAAKTLITL